MAEFLIDAIFPTQRINLIGGSSNVGKTRWILPMMVEWSKGRPIMGFPSHPRPWAYVSGDRLLNEAKDTIASLGLTDVPLIPAFGEHAKTWVQVLIEAKNLNVEVLVWEGFGDLPADPQRRVQVKNFISSIGAFCCPQKDFPKGLTIIGIMESPKMKPHERYKNPRERISGVAAWGYHTSSVLMLDHANPDDISDSHRILSASLKLANSFTSLGQFDASGHIEFGPPETLQVMDSEDIATELARFADQDARSKRRNPA